MDEPTRPHIRRRTFGYDRAAVDAILEENTKATETQTSELAAVRAKCNILENEVRSARQEVRYWTDRQAYIDGEAQRVRGVVEEILRDAREGAVAIHDAAQEQAAGIVRTAKDEAAAVRVAAREQADQIDAEARERAMQVLDRVCAQSDEILARANAAAERIGQDALRAERQSQERLDAIRALTRQMEDRIRRTIKTFGHAADELGEPSPQDQSLPMTVARSIRATAASTDSARENRAAVMGSMSSTNDLFASVEELDGNAPAPREPVVLRAVVSEAASQLV